MIKIALGVYDALELTVNWRGVPTPIGTLNY